MKMKNIALEISVVLACYLIMTLPVASATSVNIIFNGQTMESVEYDPTNIVNQHVTYVKDPRDVSWSRIRVAITLNSASLAHTIKKVYLYKCGSLAPVSCLQKTPEVFDSYVDTEIAWDDIAQSTGQTKYPQEGNLLFLVKLEDPDGFTSWTGLWNTIKRNSHKEFFFYRHELSDVDVYAKSSNLVGPIASYIQNFNSIPFRWLTSASFSDAMSISAIGGDDRDLETSPPTLQSVEPTGTDIDVINKENYFVFPKISSGFAFPITLEQNPDFECGDGRCESNLGEDMESCCYDCGCLEGYYCDTPEDLPEEGSCKNEALINLDVVGTPSAEVDDCSHSLELGVTARINNPPVGLEDELTGVLKIEDTPYAIHCTQSGAGLYDCSVSMMPTVECGSGARDAGPNELKLTVSYNDGKNRIITDLTELFPAVSLNYDCSCPQGYYCDTGSESCQSEESITLGITELTSYLDNYNGGDTIDLTAKVFNPPTGMVLVSASAGLNLTKPGGMVSPGTPVCTGPSEDYEYECSIPFSITGYLKSEDYKFYPNFLSFRITYNDADKAKTSDLTTEFGPMSIPSQDCGNGVCNEDEDADSCCADCGCPTAGDYCDRVRGCSPLSGITLSALPHPLEVEDCKRPNEVNLRAVIANAPYGVTLDYYSIIVNNQPVPWKIECPSMGEAGGVFNCMFEIQPMDGCELPHYIVGPNKLSFTVSFPNGANDQNVLSTEINTTFADVFVIPVPHIDGKCESNLGENGSTACLDCPCIDDPVFGEGYYCDAGPLNPSGTCLLKSDVSLAVESPTEPVWFDTCEELNKVSVIMHVNNQPTGMERENVYATLGGEAARYVHCRESTGTYLDSNVTLNCTIGIPPIDDCSQGATYNYTNNSISLIISYEDGQNRKVLQTLTADLPNFYIHQTIRTMHDITQEAQDQMRTVLDNIMTLTERTMDILQKCIEMQMAVMIMNIVVSLAMGYAGGKSVEGENWSWKGFGDGMSAGARVGEGLSSMVEKWCENLKEMNKIEIKLQEMQMEKIKMQLCLDVAQHHLDSGDCRNKEESCFSNIVGCLDFSEMDSILRSIDGSSKKIINNIGDMGNTISDIGYALGDVFGDGTGTTCGYLSAEIGQAQLHISDGAVACKYSGSSTRGTITECKETKITIRRDKPDNCKNVFVTSNGAVLGAFTPSQRSEIRSYELSEVTNDNDDNTISLYCSDDNVFDISRDKEICSGMTFHVAAQDDDNCNCEYEGKPFTDLLSSGTNNNAGKKVPSQTEASKVKDAIQIKSSAGDWVYTFDSTDELEAHCYLPKGSWLNIIDKECDKDNDIWLKVRTYSTPSDSSACKKGDEGWVYLGPAKQNTDCFAKIEDLVEKYEESVAGVSGTGSSDTDLGETISFKDGFNPVKYVACRSAIAVNKMDDYSNFESDGIDGWECETYKGCYEAPACGEGYFVCDKRTLNSPSLGDALAYCNLQLQAGDEAFFVVTCEKVSVPCSNDEKCDLIFTQINGENRCQGNTCNRDDNFYFLCSDVPEWL